MPVSIRIEKAISNVLALILAGGKGKRSHLFITIRLRCAGSSAGNLPDHGFRGFAILTDPVAKAAKGRKGTMIR